MLAGALVSGSRLVPGQKPFATSVASTRDTSQRFSVRADAQKERQPWDFGRFIRTVTYFNQPPSPQQVLQALVQQPAKLLRTLQGGTVEDKKSMVLPLFGNTITAGPAQGPSSAGGGRGSVVLVAGATGGVGKRVVEELLRQGKSVRALVRDVDKAQSMLGGLAELAASGASLQLVAGDITQPQTLLPEYFDGVRGAVLATAVKVTPKEGDTAGRDKYYQGIKFYDPEIVGDTPETVEFKGVSNIVAALAEQLGILQGKAVFAADGKGAVSEWGPLDDVVMGGVSESGFEVRQSGGEGDAPTGVFSGLVRTENSGGFASVRTKNIEPALNLAVYDGLELRLKGDGQRYKAIIRTDTSWDGIGYCRSFDTKAGEWQTVRLPFAEFAPVFRARTLRDGTTLGPSSITSIQLMLSKFEYDGELNPSFRPGPFSLPIGSITAYLAPPVTPRLVHVSSAGVTRPDRPGINVDQEPPAVKLNDELGGILTYKLQGEDVVRGSGVPYAVVRPCALTEEPAGAELVLDQGDTIKGKISREDVAQLCVALLSEPAGLNTTFEVKSTVPFSTPFQIDPANPPKPRDWKALLEGSGLQQGVTGKTINGRYTGKEPEAVLSQQPVAV